MKNKNRTEDNRKTLCSCCCIKWNLKKGIGNNKSGRRVRSDHLAEGGYGSSLREAGRGRRERESYLPIYQEGWDEG